MSSYLEKMKNLGKKAAVVVIIIALLVSFNSIEVYGATTSAAVTQQQADSTSADYTISLTENAQVKISIPINKDFDGDASDIELFLIRNSKTYVSKTLFPNQKKGGALESWKTIKDSPMFTDIEKTITTSKGNKTLNVVMNSNCYFGEDTSVPHTNGGYYMDVCGYFDLKAIQDKSLVGKVSVKVVPYEKFNTMSEMYSELSQIANYDTDLYVQKLSLGKSTGGRDIPYLIIADKKSSVDKWKEFTELAETSPEKAIEKIKNGDYDDIRVPVLYSNVHANEVSAADGIMDFAWNIVKKQELPYNYLESFTEEGKAQLEKEMGTPGQKGSVAVPDLSKDSATYLGYLKAGNRTSGVVDLEKYYNVEKKNIKVKDLLKDVFFILVPEENVDGRTYLTRTAWNGYDLNRDNSFQTTSETASMQRLIGTYNPVSFTEFHGRVKGFQCEPCDPPHEPNFEYDLLSEHLMTGGEALGRGAVANNSKYNSYVIPQRDYLSYTGTGSQTCWEDPWDDMSTSYTPQFAMLQGTVAYTVELPAYNDDTVDAVNYGIISQSDYISDNKLDYLLDQTEIFKRGVNNYNSNSFDEVGQWLCDQNDVEGAEIELFRPVYDGEGENNNFYPECYIIPLDRENQKNLQAAVDMMEWLCRNDVKVKLAQKSFTYDGKTYPKGTMIVPMYQAKRSVANGALYDGTLIQNWTVLYSEGITSFGKTRGFDAVTVAEPAEYEKIAAASGNWIGYTEAKKYAATFKSSFKGTKNAEVIINNVSEDSTAAVNALLKSGKKVGMITEGDEKGDFICAYEDYLTVSKEYVLTATGVSGKGIKAKIIYKLPLVYVPGDMADTTAGYVNSDDVSRSYNWSYDKLALKLMNFQRTSDLEKADVIVGATALNDAEKEKVKSGVPYIGYNCSRRKDLDFIDGISTANCEGAMDCLGYVEYPNETLVNATYINEGDDVMYGYGVGYFDKIPEGAVTIVKMKDEQPLEGFIPAYTGDLQSGYKTFLNGSVQAFEYKKKTETENVDVALFANTLTNKGHQRDEYSFISNFIFSRTLSVRDYMTDVSVKDSADLVSYSKIAKINGKNCIKVAWKDKNGKVIDFDGYQVYRSTKRYSGYGTKPLLTTGKTYFYNTKSLKKGTTYYYKVRAYKVIDNVRYFTDWSAKSYRSV